jgi:membrane-bound lytic murein transglycosylase B
MCSRALLLGGLLLLLTLTAWAQTARYAVPAASVEDQFSAYEQTLSGAADRVLLATVPRNDVTTSPESAVSAHLPDHSALRRFAERYWNGQQQSVQSAVERVAVLRPTLDPILREEGVPEDVTALVLVESGGRVTALSPRGALGLWQFMPDTARRYGLQVGPSRDDRLDIVKSTHAAAKYLRDLYSQFGDWRLTFAAYNAGEQAIQRAIGSPHVKFANMRHPGQNGTGTFDSVSGSLPVETRNYVPAVLAAMRLLGDRLPGGLGPEQRPGSAGIIYATAFDN